MTYFQYICLECGWLYDETVGMPERNIPAGTRWEELPDTFQCGDCEITKAESHMWQKLPV